MVGARFQPAQVHGPTVTTSLTSSLCSHVDGAQHLVMPPAIDPLHLLHAAVKEPQPPGEPEMVNFVTSWTQSNEPFESLHTPQVIPGPLLMGLDVRRASLTADFTAVPSSRIDLLTEDAPLFIVKRCTQVVFPRGLRQHFGQEHRRSSMFPPERQPLPYWVEVRIFPNMEPSSGIVRCSRVQSFMFLPTGDTKWNVRFVTHCNTPRPIFRYQETTSVSQRTATVFRLFSQRYRMCTFAAMSSSTTR